MDHESRLARKYFRAAVREMRAEKHIRALQQLARPLHRHCGKAHMRYEPKKHPQHGFTRPAHVALVRIGGRSKTIKLDARALVRSSSLSCVACACGPSGV